MKNNQNIIVLVFLFFLVILFGYRYLFTISKLEVVKEPEYLLPDGNSTITISVKPLNRFGIIIPFKKINVDFKIIEGNEKIQIVEQSHDKLILRSGYEKGIVVVHIKNLYTFIPIEIRIEIRGQLV